MAVQQPVLKGTDSALSQSFLSRCFTFCPRGQQLINQEAEFHASGLPLVLGAGVARAASAPGMSPSTMLTPLSFAYHQREPRPPIMGEALFSSRFLQFLPTLLRLARKLPNSTRLPVWSLSCFPLCLPRAMGMPRRSSTPSRAARPARPPPGPPHLPGVGGEGGGKPQPKL